MPEIVKQHIFFNMSISSSYYIANRWRCCAVARVLTLQSGVFVVPFCSLNAKDSMQFFDESFFKVNNFNKSVDIRVRGSTLNVLLFMVWDFCFGV